MKTITVYFGRSNAKNKKYRVKVMGKTIHFGDDRYQDYTIHEDKKRKSNYLNRHRKNEDWTHEGIQRAGFWSKWILWNKPTLKESLQDTAKRFNIRFKFF